MERCRLNVETELLRRHPPLSIYGTKSSVGCRGSAAYYYQYDAKEYVSHFNSCVFTRVRGALNARRFLYAWGGGRGDYCGARYWGAALGDHPQGVAYRPCPYCPCACSYQNA